MLFDTHAHLEDEQLFPMLGRVLENASSAGLVGITTIGTTAATSRKCAQLAREYPQIHSAVGIHPNHCQDATELDWQEILNLSKQSEVVAIGETGLDRYWDYCSIEQQRIWFAKHIELSFETEKPLVIHMRECESDILAMLKEHQRNGKVIGIMHSFAGSWETARQCLDLGMYISFAGMLTFKKSNELRELATRIPEDRILVETDSPYLTPHPHRSQRPNQPAMVCHTASCLADVRGVDLELISAITTANAKRVFNLND